MSLSDSKLIPDTFQEFQAEKSFEIKGYSAHPWRLRILDMAVLHTVAGAPAPHRWQFCILSLAHQHPIYGSSAYSLGAQRVACAIDGSDEALIAID